MSGNLTVANGIAKISGGLYQELIPTKALLYNRMNKGEGKPIGDRGFELPIGSALPFNHGFPADGGDLPIGESVETIRALVMARRYMHAIRLTGKAMQMLGKNKSNMSYVKDWSRLNIDAAIEAAYKMQNWYGWGTGNGRLATISTGATSATQTVSNNDKDRAIRKNMRISIVASDFSAIRGSARITSESGTGSATTFTMSASIASTTGDYVVISGGSNAAITGLGLIIDDTTNASVYFQNVDRNTYLRYRAQCLTASSNGLSQALLRRILGAKILPALNVLNRGDYEIWSHPAQLTAYGQLGWNLKRWTGDSKSQDLGFTTYEFEGIPWVEEVDAPKDIVDFIDWSTMQKFTAKDWGWDETTGDIFRQVPSSTSGVAYTDNYEAYYDTIANYGCTNPQANAQIYSLALPTGF